MAKKYFGTDGVRGEVGKFPVTPEFVLKLAYAAGHVLVQHGTDHQPTVLIGKDTRISGYMLEAAMEAGFTAAGIRNLLFTRITNSSDFSFNTTRTETTGNQYGIHIF